MEFSNDHPSNSQGAAACHEGELDHSASTRNLIRALKQNEPIEIDGRLYLPIAKTPTRLVLLGTCLQCSFPYAIDGVPADLLRHQALPKTCARHRATGRPQEMPAAEREALQRLLDGRIGKQWKSALHDIPAVRQRPNHVTVGDFRSFRRGDGIYVAAMHMRERARDGALVKSYSVVAPCLTCRQLFTYERTAGQITPDHLELRCPDHAHIRRMTRPIRWTAEMLERAKEFGR